MEKPDEDFQNMTKALVQGMWVMNPFLEYNVFVCYLYMTLANSNYDDLQNDFIKPLTSGSKVKLNYMVFMLNALQYSVMRIIYKYIQIGALWLMKKLPFLAFYKFGTENSYVTI